MHAYALSRSRRADRFLRGVQALASCIDASPSQDCRAASHLHRALMFLRVRTSHLSRCSCASSATFRLPSHAGQAAKRSLCQAWQFQAHPSLFACTPRGEWASCVHVSVKSGTVPVTPASGPFIPSALVLRRLWPGNRVSLMKIRAVSFPAVELYNTSVIKNASSLSTAEC